MSGMRIRKSGKYRWLVAIVLIAAIFVLAITWLNSGSTQLKVNRISQNTNNKVEEARIVSANSRWLFMGDTFFGRYINDWSNASSLKEKYPFQRLNEFNRDSYQAWIANFECPFADGVNMTSEQMNRALQFNCDSKYLPEASKWFTAVSLANNHTDNQGVKGFEQTHENLAANKIQYFGGYDPRDHDNVCNVVTLDFVIKSDDQQQKTASLPIGFCGYNAVFRVPTDSDIAVITQYAKILPTFVMPHMGVEYQAAPDRLRIAVFHKMIDAGAEMVIGGHPHWVQPSEVYKGKLIVYSMGNFIFDQQVGPEKTRSAMIDVKVSIKNLDQVDKWSSIATQCKNDFSRCVELLKAGNLSKLEMTYEFDVKGSNSGNKSVKPATASELQSIKERLNWDATMQNLGQS